MAPLTIPFNERLQEIDAYLDLLDALEQQVRSGAPKIGAAPITSQHQKILYSSLYLQLYNLVEATVTWCLKGVMGAACDPWFAGDLSADMRREWVRTTARTHDGLNVENRFATTIATCEQLFTPKPLAEWGVEKGGGGNWDDTEIETITNRLGCAMRISPPVYQEAKRRIREDRGALALVKYLRNQLAHGSISFSECGDGVTVADLRDLHRRVSDYLREVVQAFQDYIDNHHFLRPERRPGPPPPP